MKTADIDPNFRSNAITKSEIIWLDPCEEPFEFFGLCHSDHRPPFCRMQPSCLDRFNANLQELAYNTAGIRVRFRTNSGYFALKARIRSGYDMSHMPRTGSSGFDLYCGNAEKQSFVKVFMPDAQSDEVIGEYFFPDHEMKEVTVNFPLYNGVNSIAFGFEDGAAFEKPKPYGIAKPVLFYGSSITQGGCASRPGNSYPLILSRLLDAEIINLGFSGNAMGEKEMAEYIAALQLSAFVLDYDYNAPDAGHLTKTHFTFYKTVRESNPDLPILLLSKPNFNGSEEDVSRREVIHSTYLKAKELKDGNIYYIDGEKLFGTEQRDACTVDTVHPNDLGFMRMAECVYPVLKQILGIQ